VIWPRLSSRVSLLLAQLWYILVYTMFILRVIQALQKHQVPYALVGGYAVALHGAVRGTLDVDLVLPFVEKHFVHAEKALQSMGLKARLPVSAHEVYTFRSEYIEKKDLTAWSFCNPDNPAELVDVIITHDLRKMATKVFQVQNVRVKAASIRDLIKMKKQAGREQDLADIRALEKLR
jgi:hypothetical protein